MGGPLALLAAALLVLSSGCDQDQARPIDSFDLAVGSCVRLNCTPGQACPAFAGAGVRYTCDDGTDYLWVEACRFDEP